MYPERAKASPQLTGATMSNSISRISGAAAIVVLLCASLQAQSAQSASPSLPDSHQVLAFLNQTIDWFRHLSVEEQLADQPTDVLFMYNDRQTADQVLVLAFDFARADAQLLSSEGSSAAGSSPDSNPSQYQNLAQLASKAADAVTEKQQQLDALKQKLPATQGRARVALQYQIDTVQSDLDLAQTRSDTLSGLLQFISSTDGTGKVAGGGLLSQINELEQSVPEARSESPANSSAKTPPAPNPSSSPFAMPVSNRAQPSGILGLTSDVLALRRKIRTLDDSSNMANALYHSSRTLIAPLGATLNQAMRQSDDLSNQAASTDPATMAQRKQQVDALEAQFKGISAAVIPLAKQGILLNRYQASLTSWRNALLSQRRDEVRTLLVRLAMLGAVLLIATAIFEVWRRVTFHYVHELHRRNQFLLLRRIVMIITFAVILALGFSTDLGSLTTFAGLLAAGLAVCLQSVILSALGYFVLLGKYSIRVGDRIQISGVTGNVVDIDLMRISLMELGESGTGSDLVPTGRTVEFPNAIVFQPTSGLFKQIPGANFLWHEVTLTLAADGDYHTAQKRMMDAVNAVFDGYRDKLEFQHQRMERMLNLPVEMPRPQNRLRFTQTGLEVVIRYPVTSEKAAEIDERITRALLDVMDQEPHVKSVGSPAPSMPPPPPPGQSGGAQPNSAPR